MQIKNMEGRCSGLNRKLRKMKKIELLEMLLEQEREIEKLQAENEELKEKLENKRLTLEKAGSIAEAALSLSGVFEAVQKAAEMYLESVKPEDAVDEETETATDEVTDTETATDDEETDAAADIEKNEESIDEEREKTETVG